MNVSEAYEFSNVTDHAFLPRKIRPVECKAAEVALVAHLSEFISGRPEEKVFHSMVTNWLSWIKTSPSCKDLAAALSTSLPVAVPLVDHNAVVLFTQGNSPDVVLVSAIDIWPHDSSIHSKSNDNELFPSDFRLAVPRYSGLVHRSQVTSIVFLEQLSALSNSQWSFPERNPKTTRANYMVIDTHKPAHPVYVFEWLMATLQQIPLDTRHSNVQHRVLFKRVRLESTRKNAYDKPWTRSSAWVALKSTLHVAMIQMDGFDNGGCRYKLMMAEFKASLVLLALEHYLEHPNGEGYQFGDIIELNAHLAKTASKLQHFSLASGTFETIKSTTELVETALKLVWEGFLKREETDQQINLQSLMPYVASPSCDAPNLMKRAKTVLSQALVTDNVLESMRSSKTPQKSKPPGRQVYHNSSSDATFDRLMKEINSSGTRPDDMERALQAVEIFIRTRLWPKRSKGLLTDSIEVQVTQGSSLLKAYHKAASNRYEKTAIRMSKMILYSHTLLAWIDSLCIHWDQLGIVGQHQLFCVDPAELQGLLLMNASDLDLLHELCDYLRIRTDSKLKPSIADVSAYSLAFMYATNSETMLNYEAQYQIEVEELTNAKIAEVDRVKEKYEKLREEEDQLECQCVKARKENNRKWYTITCTKCLLKKNLDSLEQSVSAYERRLPDDKVARLCVIFHSKLIPKVLRNYRESCALLVDVCLSEKTANTWGELESKPLRWSNETPFTFLMALGSEKKPLTKTHYGKGISILQSESNFLLPQRKNVLMGIKVKGIYRYLGTPKWDLTSYCQLPIAHPYTALKFTVYDVHHSENDVLVLQCNCPAELQLVAFKDFGTLRAGGGYLQWRNIAVALESGILDLCDPSVAALLLSAAYQAGPLPATDNWNYDLTEPAFVEEMCNCVQLVMDRIKPSWNSSRALYLCICLLSYVADHTLDELSEQPLNLLSHCRKICIEWSDSIEKTLANYSKGDLTARHLYFVNGLVVLTFGAERSTLSDDASLFEFLRARTIMFEQNLVNNQNAEFDLLAALCIRTSARHQPFIHEHIGALNFQALNRLVTDRWAHKKIIEWSRCSSSPVASEGVIGKKSRKKEKKAGKGSPWEIDGNPSVVSDFYWADCIAQDDTCAIVHVDVVEGTFLVDGEPAGRLPDRILYQELFQRAFPDASSLAVFHRGGGVFETKRALVNGTKFTFAIKDYRELIIREIDDEGISRRLLSREIFKDELPQSLVEDYTHWMTYGIPGNCVIELRPLKDRHNFQPVYIIQLDTELRGQVIHCETSRKMLNFTGNVFDQIYRTLGWRLDQKRFIEPYWSTITENSSGEVQADNWSVCLYYPRLHLHLKIRVDSDKIKVTVLEYENMVVSSNQYLGSFIGLNQMLVLERPNGLRTVIIPHFGFRAVKHNKHHRLEIVDEIVNKYQNSELCYGAAQLLDSKYTSFAFDEDRSLRQMRPNGEETYEKWLMCAYLHGATCSAMAEPLTGLTGLEMALKQLRRCRVNKPLSETSLSILKRIEELAVKRGVVYDSLTVNWPDVHSSYSSSDAYIPLIQFIKTKSKNLSELYETRPQQRGKDSTRFARQENREEDFPTEELDLVKYAYSRYEFIYSPAARLDSREKMKLGITLAKAPIVPFISNILPNSCLTYKLIHAGMCKMALEDEILKGDFNWITFIKEFDYVDPVFGLDQLLHIGHWSKLCFYDGSMWLTLLAKAIVCHSTTGHERALYLKRFIQLLSFAAWKLSNSNNPPSLHKNRLNTYITALGRLLKLAVSSLDSRVTPKLPSIEHLPSKRVQFLGQRFLDETKIDFSRAISDSTIFENPSAHVLLFLEQKVVMSRSDFNAIMWQSVKCAKVWMTENSNIIAITTERYPEKEAFLDIINSIPEGIPVMEWEKTNLINLAQRYYEELFHRQQLYKFISLLDEQTDCIHRGAITGNQNCLWPCFAVPSLEVAIFQKPSNYVSSTNDSNIDESFESMRVKDEIGDGQCPELEEAFLQCLIKIESPETKVKEFPLQLGNEFEGRPISADIISKLRLSWDHHQRATKNIVQFQLVKEIRQKLSIILERAQCLCKQSWTDVIMYFKEQQKDVLSRIQSFARISSPVAPRVLFPLYGRRNLPVAVQRLVEKHLIYQVYAQKAQRCLLLLDTTEAVVDEEDRRHSAVRLVAEITETHCSGWTPQQHPKWLLFEVENNIIIRKKQALVANEILADNKQILQLNMGEGKTSVITPLVCTAMATTSSVVRITLLTSLLETHGQELALRLGGILEHPIYYFPCSREVTFNEPLVNKMIKQFNECLEEGGSIVTVPEHRLSMMHKFDELCIRYQDATAGTIPPTAAAFLNLFNLFRCHVVDIVDEADEILRYKYQLLYTIGVQEAVDGGERRWKVAQQVLQLLQVQFDAFCEENVEKLHDNIVHSSDNEEKGSASWPHIRLIGDKLDDKLNRLLIDQVLSGNTNELKFIATLSSSCIDSLRRYLIDDDDSEVKTIIKPHLSDSQWLDILVLRGLLTYKILHHCLKKRWSVDYGVDVKTRRRLAAVPFCGMDTPMERTDFGHPDVGLVFTHLSYYYSGLDDGQMMQAFVRLKELAQRDAEYLKWLDASEQDKEWLSEKGIVTDVKAINLDDSNQVCLLVQFFRFNIATIHFWLNTFVLPKETKQFPTKLVASSWDLARPQSQSMRGFSGTKDSSRLLPIQVELGSLEQLDGTDGDVLDRILRLENRRVLQFSMDVCSGDQIIDFIVSTDSAQPSVLIDVGALMVGMSNHQVAKYWLSQAPEKFVAAAYFDEDQVTVLLRDGHSTPLAFSPLKQCLDKVLIYLDDIHTRGTDFKFPIPSHAVVTLGRDLPKDKLVQAAMRMRQLGHGHSVSFLAPPEIYSQLSIFLEDDQPEPDSSHVLSWALQNTVYQLEKGMMEWAAQGTVFSRREAAIQFLTNAIGSSDGSISPKDLKTYLHLVQIPEFTRLEEMYGPKKMKAEAVDVVSAMQNRMLNSLSEWSRKEFNEEISNSTLMLRNTLSEIAPRILNRCREFLSMVQVDSRCLDEEQEREIEEEREEEAEREVYRPGPEKPYKPDETSFQWVKNLIHSPSGALGYLRDGEAQPLIEALKQTTVYSLLNESGFDSRIVTSYNFRRTLQDEVAQQDEFVRPPRWALAVWSGTNVQHLVLLSTVEADLAIRELRLQPANPVSLHRFAPRTRRDQSELLTSGLTTGDIGPLESFYFAISALNLFGSSCCFQRDFSSIGDICRYLGVVPPPCANYGGLSSSDWRVLVDKKLIQPDGFVERRAVVKPEGISNKGWATVKQTRLAHQWPISSVTFFRFLVPLRNMDAWFSGSDLSSILLPT